MLQSTFGYPPTKAVHCSGVSTSGAAGGIAYGTTSMTPAIPAPDGARAGSCRRSPCERSGARASRAISRAFAGVSRRKPRVYGPVRKSSLPAAPASEDAMKSIVSSTCSFSGELRSPPPRRAAARQTPMLRRLRRARRRRPAANKRPRPTSKDGRRRASRRREATPAAAAMRTTRPTRRPRATCRRRATPRRARSRASTSECRAAGWATAPWIRAARRSSAIDGNDAGIHARRSRARRIDLGDACARRDGCMPQLRAPRRAPSRHRRGVAGDGNGRRSRGGRSAPRRLV